MDAPPAFTVALLGAESTGKTTLALGLGQALRARGLRVAVVAEYLREFCDAKGRTPVQAEQRHIAEEQTRRIDAACQGHEVIVADTTALTIAVYSEVVFGDRSLYPDALAAHRRRRGLTLLTALDLPWQADGLQRDGPHARAPVDALFRAHLQRAGIAYGVVAGLGDARLAHALRAAVHALGLPPAAPAADARDGEGESGAARWRAACDRCSDPDCERRCLLLPSQPIRPVSAA